MIFDDEEKLKKPKKKKNKERERERKRVTAFVVVLSSREVFLSVKKKERDLRDFSLTNKRSHPITAKKSRQIEDKDGDVRRGRGEQFQPVELSREPHETTRDVVAVR